MPTQLELISLLKRTDVTGALGAASTAELEAYASALCHPGAYGEFGDRQFPQICETVRVHLLRAHIQALQSHITKLDEKSTKLSWLVVVLTVASLFGAGGQIWFAYKADKKSEQTSPSVAASPQTTPSQQTAPSPAATQVSGQPIKKLP